MIHTLKKVAPPLSVPSSSFLVNIEKPSIDLNRSQWEHLEHGTVCTVKQAMSDKKLATLGYLTLYNVTYFMIV